MAAMKGYAQLALRKLSQMPSAADLVTPLDTIARQVDRLTEMVSLMLDVSRIHIGRIELHRSAVDLVSMARDAVAEAQTASDRHVITFTAQPRVLIGQWDGVRLGQVFGNLLSNAVKYSPEGGDIGVSVAQTDGYGVVAITDQGLGVPVQELELIFERYYRSAGLARSAAEGLGLGLYVTRGIVEAHGGGVWIESEQGQGSTFTFRLPLSVDQVALA
jgi:signal transduction histidine kinase